MFTLKGKENSLAEDKNKKRGRPSGRTEQGEKQKKHLYQVGLKLIQEQGYENATLRKMAKQAGVSPGLFYKYYSSKGALVLELHEDLTSAFEKRFESQIQPGSWGQRSVETLRLSLATLAPHREALKALIPVLVGYEDQNVFSGFSEFSRHRVENLFYRALQESQSPPAKDIIEPLARLTYTVHLAVLLFWLLDKSENQKATDGVLDFYEKLLQPLKYAIKVGGAKKLIKKADALFQQGLVANDKGQD